MQLIDQVQDYCEYVTCTSSTSDEHNLVILREKRYYSKWAIDTYINDGISSI